MKTLLDEIKKTFEHHQREDDAMAMRQYMKNHFSFLGIRSPLRKEISKQFLSIKLQDELELLELVHGLWQMEAREYQYLAIEFLTKNNKLISLTSIFFIEQLVQQKSWWDTVDALASNVVGPVLLRSPDEMHLIVSPWISSDNLWLNRTAIIFQLKYKEETRLDILKRAILLHIDSTEFFHKKAIGWALRQYSKIDPTWVAEFLEDHQLQPLSVREASKYL